MAGREARQTESRSTFEQEAGPPTLAPVEWPTRTIRVRIASMLRAALRLFVAHNEVGETVLHLPDTETLIRWLGPPHQSRRRTNRFALQTARV